MSTILAVMRIPPHPDGHGGSQRGWHLVRALRRLGEVHFVLVSRRFDHDAATVSLAPLAPLVESVTHIDVPEWQPRPDRVYRYLHGGWLDLFGMRSAEAPFISPQGLAAIADQLPIRTPDIVFAGRLPTAVITQRLIDRGLVRASRAVVDFDDIMSRFRAIELRASRKRLGKQGGLLARVDLQLIRRAEDEIARRWDAISVCTTDDAQALRTRYPDASVVKVPNVVERELLPPAAPSAAFRVLFVGNLSFSPNVEGLARFVDEGGWARVQRAVPNARLTVVGINPNEQVRALVREHGFELHADVPSVLPYYRDADVVIAPILLGSGTRIKILEALAYGRAVVSTPLGASGLDVTHGHDILLAEAMTAFADNVIALARDPAHRERIAANGRALQQRAYSAQALDAAIAEMITPGAATSATPAPIGVS